MERETLKQAAADAALEQILHRLEPDTIIGIGTGSTVNHFIDALAAHRGRFDGAVSSSEASAERLRNCNIKVYDLNAVNAIPVYVDGADEINPRLEMIKGGGGALTHEKILAAAAQEFICIADAGKQVEMLGNFPLPVEIIPMARGLVARKLAAMGGNPAYRQGFVTDNGNIILDVHGLDISRPVALEEELNQLTGAVCNGIFARRPADRLLLASEAGVQESTRPHP